MIEVNLAHGIRGGVKTAEARDADGVGPGGAHSGRPNIHDRRPFRRRLFRGGILARRRDALHVVFQGGLQGLLGEDRAMDLHRGQVRRGHRRPPGSRTAVPPEGPALDQLGGHARTGDGGTASERLEARVGDAAVLHLEAHLHDVAACGGANFPDAVGVRQIPHVSGIHEVVHDGLVVQRVGVAHVQDSKAKDSLVERVESLQ
jgi:hypothetical protein